MPKKTLLSETTKRTNALVDVSGQLSTAAKLSDGSATTRRHVIEIRTKLAKVIANLDAFEFLHQIANAHQLLDTRLTVLQGQLPSDVLSAREYWTSFLPKLEDLLRKQWDVCGGSLNEEDPENVICQVSVSMMTRDANQEPHKQLIRVTITLFVLKSSPEQVWMNTSSTFAEPE